MLIPRKVKHRKCHKGRARNKRIATDKIDLAYGQYGIKALTGAWVSARQIEAARRVLTRYTRRGGKIWIRIFADKPITKKGNEVPMGAGKGAVDHYIAVVKPGTVMFEMDGIPRDSAKEALQLARYKLSCRAKFIAKNEI
ncbi:50S ribosomal protein L16 [Patescibacteria group bacterium]|nr:50S ribosomal protein L16 [Patescibacteria group bacterium]MBU1034498.1 50S ribosomal protein L16 [Patescibacteria group bacterium]MBU1629829.1 50S ribosomal protein L16 [Patescibacteria group bacterium]MBU1908024.1 50S ribosomal protein L16 [Patescibacteria group bacterium]